MKPDETNDNNKSDGLPKVGESFDVWFAGHIPVDCVSHNDDGTPVVRMPWGEEMDAQWDGVTWEVHD